MKANEVLERQTYVDIALSQSKAKPSRKNIIRKIRLLKKIAAQKSVKQLRKHIQKIDPGAITGNWFDWYHGLYAKPASVLLEKCRIDERHGQLDEVKTNKDYLALFLKKQSKNGEMIRRTKHALEYIDIFSKELPPIVEREKNDFLVRAGNHRILAALKNGQKKVNVLLVKKTSNGKGYCKSLSFTWP